MSNFWEYWAAVFRETARLYFAPIVGALRGIRDEYRRIEADNMARRMRTMEIK
jgi:hypothetical protein